MIRQMAQLDQEPEPDDYEEPPAAVRRIPVEEMGDDTLPRAGL